jgi:flagellar biosynthesis protein FlhF
MRLKTYHAPTMSEAMRMVREQLGPDAIIVATHEDKSTHDVRITAAVEQTEQDYESAPEDLNIVDQLSNVLDGHGAPMALVDRLMNTVTQLGIADETLALAGALDECFTFAPLPDGQGDRPLMFIGPPGCGKTVSIAKLAVRMRLAGNAVRLITTDTLRAGAVEQLTVYGMRLGIDIETADTPRELADSLAKAGDTAQILIDSTGVNPHDPEDRKRLCEFTEAAALETVVVMRASGDPIEAAELCAAFHIAGPTRLVMTQLDMVRRLGGMLAAAEASALPFGDVSMAPDIAAGLQSINPVSLARLLLSDNTRDYATVSEIFQATGS